MAIRYQLGMVDPLMSITYRFFLAGALLMVYCKLKGLNLTYSIREHLFIALGAFFLFGVNYWLVYVAELHLTSGLVAIVFTTIIFFNILFGAFILKSAIRWPVLLGGIIGMGGVGLIFLDDIRNFDLSNKSALALVWTLIAVVLSSLGNIVSARNQRAGLPVLQSNAYGMCYGSLMMLVIALAMGTPISFDFSWPYIGSLLYLAIFGSIIAFGSYLTLLGKIGADKAGYIGFITPLIALVLSTLFEGYHWPTQAIGGVALVLVGNLLALWGKKKTISS